MCGRFVITAPVPIIAELFDLGGMPELAPRYNVAPTQTIPAVRAIDDKGRELVLLRWGLIPSWAKDKKLAASLINARSDSVAEKPAFRSAFKRRRCLIPADGFYEWKTADGKKQPYLFRLIDNRPFAFAGLWERWHGPEGDVESCTLITTDANEVVRPVHNRMPVILDRNAYGNWLDPNVNDKQTLQALLQPFDPSVMIAQAVSLHVNNARNDDPGCLLPAG
jgi:putative SOS response-associated peptidase YedK